MKLNQWTVGYVASGAVSLALTAQADLPMSQVQTALTQTTLGGYVDTAMQWNPGTDMKPGSFPYPGNVPKYSFAQDDGFQLNAVDVALDKAEDSSQWAAGYHVEMMYGAAAVGVPIGGSSTAPATVRQAFIRLHTPLIGNGIDWQLGVFDSIIGYESSSDPLNPNYTRSYGYTIEPTTLTGILGTYKVNDNIAMSAGIANIPGGQGNVRSLGAIPPSFVPTAGYGSAGYESQKTYMGDLMLTAPDSFGFLKGATLSGGVVHGVNSTYGLNSGATTSIYVGAAVPTPINALKVGACFDYLLEAGRVLVPPPPFGLFHVSGNDDIWVVGAYTTVQATDKLSFDLRGEYVSDDSDPADVENLYAHLPNITGNAAEELTATVQYNLWANVLTRGEFRWDHVEHGNPFGANSDGAQFRSNDYLLALNIIFQF